MVDFASLRRNMVNGQIRANEVTDTVLINAFLEVPREQFVPEASRALAYRDDVVAVGEGPGVPRGLMAPMHLARMIQALDLQPTDRVLVVGCATGYSAAILARLAGTVTALDEDGRLTAAAAQTLQQLGVANANVVTGPLAAGHAAGAPYDAILVDGAAEQIPAILCEQLRESGRLVAILGSGGAARAILFRALAGKISETPLFNATAPLLRGFEKPKTFLF